jgi:hypothetical protein
MLGSLHTPGHRIGRRSLNGKLEPETRLLTSRNLRGFSGTTLEIDLSLKPQDQWTAEPYKQLCAALGPSGDVYFTCPHKEKRTRRSYTTKRPYTRPALKTMVTSWSSRPRQTLPTRPEYRFITLPRQLMPNCTRFWLRWQKTVSVRTTRSCLNTLTRDHSAHRATPLGDVQHHIHHHHRPNNTHTHIRPRLPLLGALKPRPSGTTLTQTTTGPRIVLTHPVLSNTRLGLHLVRTPMQHRRQVGHRPHQRHTPPRCPRRLSRAYKTS